MKKPYQRTPRGYDGKECTTHQIEDVLPYIIQKIGRQVHAQGQLIIEMWPNVVGPQLAPMARAIRFYEKTLYVHVSNSTLLSLLHNPQDKQRLILELQKRVPGAIINNIVFKIG